MSRDPPQPAESARLAPLLAALGTLVVLLWFALVQPLERTGDGVVYALQAAAGHPGERSLHAGFLVPLWAHSGVVPEGAPFLVAKAWSAWWVVVAGLAAAAVAAGLERQDTPRPPLLPRHLWATATLWSLGPSWDAALYVEVYGQVAALALVGLALLQRRRDILAGLLLGWGGLVHPGLWALVPGLALLIGRRPWAALATLALTHGLGLALLWPDWWSGGRGVLHLPPFQRGPISSLAGLLAWIGLGPALLLTVLRARAGRTALAMATVALGCAVGLDRYADNPGQLPTLWLLAALAPQVERRRLLALAAAAGLVLSLVQQRRIATELDAQASRWARTCDQPFDGPWGERQRRSVVCSD